MEPDIRYTRAADGVNIAYWTLGEGEPLVYMPPMPQHVQLDWRYQPTRMMYEWLARRHQLIRFDQRGSGLSQRDNIDVSPGTELLDIEAVVARLGLDSFDLFSHGTSVERAVLYAARNPEKIRNLVLVSPLAPFPETYVHPPIRALTTLMPVDHDVWTEVLASATSGWQGGDMARQYAALMRASMTHEQRLKDVSRNRAETVEEFARCLPLVRAPTLIVYQDSAVAVPPSSPQRLAAEIHDARLVRLEGEAVSNAITDPLMMTAVDEFLLGDQRTSAGAALPTGMAVVLFVDIASSTALTERMGDEGFRTASRELDRGVRDVITGNAGSAIEGKVMGDGVMGVFTSASQAINAARACNEISARSELGLHIGLHAGDVIREDNNVYGGAVNIASRVCDASTPGEILVSATVRDLARTSANVTFEDRGERTLKGIDDPVRVFAVLG